MLVVPSAAPFSLLPFNQTKLLKAAAYERGTADRGKQAEAEALQLQDAAEKALEEVKQGARVTIEEMAARHSEELEAERK